MASYPVFLPMLADFREIHVLSHTPRFPDLWATRGGDCADIDRKLSYCEQAQPDGFTRAFHTMGNISFFERKIAFGIVLYTQTDFAQLKPN